MTGANGYIAGWIVELLLKDGFVVHGTVRDPNARKNQFLKDVAAKHKAGDRLKLFKADLQEKGSFHAAVKGCDVVIHTAAVVVLTYKTDPFKEMINPTLDGVRNVVEACIDLNVKRLVYTSSVGTIACHEDYRPLKDKGTPFTEEMWLTHTSPTYATYNYMKIEAEKLLYQLWGNRPLVCILPSWTVGPQQNNQVTSSMQIVKLIACKEKPLLPLLWFDMVDVRDVAQAHIFAAVNTTLPNGRYNVTGNRNNPTSVIRDMIKASFPNLDLPKVTAPYWLLWTISWFDRRISTQMLRERTSQWAPIDTHKIKSAGFEFKYTNLILTLKDAVDSLKEHGILSTA